MLVYSIHGSNVLFISTLFAADRFAMLLVMAQRFVGWDLMHKLAIRVRWGGVEERFWSCVRVTWNFTYFWDLALFAWVGMCTEVFWEFFRLELAWRLSGFLKGFCWSEHWHFLDIVRLLLLDNLQTWNLLSPSEFKLLIRRNWFGQFRSFEAILKHRNAASFIVVMVTSLRMFVDIFIAVAKSNVLLAWGDGSLKKNFVPNRSITWNPRQGVILYLLQGLFLFLYISPTFHIFFYILYNFLEGPKSLFSQTVDNLIFLKHHKEVPNHLLFTTGFLFYRIISKIFTYPNLDNPKCRPPYHTFSNTKQTEPSPEVIDSLDDIYYFRSDLFVNFSVAYSIRYVFENKLDIEGYFVVNNLIFIDVVFVDARAVGKGIGFAAWVEIQFLHWDGMEDFQLAEVRGEVVAEMGATGVPLGGEVRELLDRESFCQITHFLK